MPTAKRIQRVRTVLSLRQPDLRVILESVTNPHNASAVLRTCDAAGVLHVHLIKPGPEAWPINAAISTRADKWLEIHTHRSLAECLADLKKRKYRIAVACLEEGSTDYDALDYTSPTALVFGNEHEGVSPEALLAADVRIRVPMLGMVQSLNLSVSVGIILFEALRQRRQAGQLGRRRLSPLEYGRLRRQWLGLRPQARDRKSPSKSKARFSGRGG